MIGKFIPQYELLRLYISARDFSLPWKIPSQITSVFKRDNERYKNWTKVQGQRKQLRKCVWTSWTISKRSKEKWPWRYLGLKFSSNPNAILPKRNCLATLFHIYERECIWLSWPYCLFSLDYKSRMTSNDCLQEKLSGKHERTFSQRLTDFIEFTGHLQALGITMRSWMPFRMWYKKEKKLCKRKEPKPAHRGKKLWLNYNKKRAGWKSHVDMSRSHLTHGELFS